MRILIVGGTRFVGRHLTGAALAAGHDVTLLHRGRTGADLFPEADHLLADRDGDLSVLAGGRWDATVDVSAYLPRQVRDLSDALDERGGRYLYISSVSAYQVPSAPGFDETSPLRELTDPDEDQVNDLTYGPLKAASERTARERFGPDTLIVRPTYVVGPYDPSFRFPYWVRRIARGGEVLAPGDPDGPIQLIDARDLATWSIDRLERGSGGVFHAVTPAPPFSFGDLLDLVVAEVGPPGTTITWVDADFLGEHGVDGESLPLAPAFDPEAASNTADPTAAYRAGLAPRPLRETIRDIEPGPETRERLTADRERALLTEWHQR